MFINNSQNKSHFLYLLFLLNPILCLIPFASEQPMLVLENSDPVTAIAFSSDGSKLITGWGECYIWDLNSGKQILTINSRGASCAAFSPDGKMAATGTDPIFSAIWNAETGEKIKAFNYKYVSGTGPIVLSAIVFHPHEPYVITSTSDGDLSKWNINTGEETPIISIGSLIDKIQIFSDGDRIATYMNIISLRNNSIMHEFESRISITSNEKFVYRNSSVNGDYSIRQIKVYDATNFSLIKEYPIFTTQSSSSLFSPDGSLVLFSKFNDDSGPLQLMRVENNEIVHGLKVDRKDNLVVTKAIFSPDGKKLAVVSEKTVYIWDISDLYSSVPESANLKQ